MKLYVIAGRGGGVQETAIRPFGQWELLSIHNICSVASEPERAAEVGSAVVASLANDSNMVGNRVIYFSHPLYVFCWHPSFPHFIRY